MGRSGVYGAAAMALPSKRGIRAGISGAASKSGCCRFFRIRGERIGGICPMRLAKGLCGGFLHFSDWVSGRDFVLTGYRVRGLAKALLAECEKWSRQKGCREMGSDCALENRESRQFHLHSGFLEAGRIICFIKDLED